MLSNSWNATPPSCRSIALPAATKVCSAKPAPSSKKRCPCRLTVMPSGYDRLGIRSVISTLPVSGASTSMGVAWQPVHWPKGFAPASSAARWPSPVL